MKISLSANKAIEGQLEDKGYSVKDGVATYKIGVVKVTIFLKGNEAEISISSAGTEVVRRKVAVLNITNVAFAPMQSYLDALNAAEGWKNKLLKELSRKYD